MNIVYPLRMSIIKNMSYLLLHFFHALLRLKLLFDPVDDAKKKIIAAGKKIDV